MYIDHIAVPYPRREQLPPGQPLTERLHDLQIEVGIRENTDSCAAITGSVAKIQELVRESLNYPRTRDDNTADYFSQPGYANSLQSLEATQDTSCFGYTIVGSECLELVGIEHYICYANGHSFIGVPLPGEDGATLRLMAYDMLFPKFNTDITDGIGFGTPKSIAGALKTNPEHQYNVTIDAHVLADAYGVSMDKLVYEAGLDWLLSGGADYGSDKRGKTHRALEPSPKSRLIMSIYAPSAGRTALQEYTNFRTGIVNGELIECLAALSQLAGRVPENDCRNPHNEIKKLIGLLCLQETFDAELTARAIGQYCTSLRTEDPRAAALRASLLSKAAQASGDIDTANHFAEEASNYYLLASKQTSPFLPNIKQAYQLKSRQLRWLGGAGP